MSSVLLAERERTTLSTYAYMISLFTISIALVRILFSLPTHANWSAAFSVLVDTLGLLHLLNDGMQPLLGLLVNV